MYKLVLHEQAMVGIRWCDRVTNKTWGMAYLEKISKTTKYTDMERKDFKITR